MSRNITAPVTSDDAAETVENDADDAAETVVDADDELDPETVENDADDELDPETVENDADDADDDDNDNEQPTRSRAELNADADAELVALFDRIEQGLDPETDRVATILGESTKPVERIDAAAWNAQTAWNDNERFIELVTSLRDAVAAIKSALPERGRVGQRSWTRKQRHGSAVPRIQYAIGRLDLLREELVADLASAAETVGVDPDAIESATSDDISKGVRRAFRTIGKVGDVSAKATLPDPFVSGTSWVHTDNDGTRHTLTIEGGTWTIDGSVWSGSEKTGNKSGSGAATYLTGTAVAGRAYWSAA